MSPIQVWQIGRRISVSKFMTKASRPCSERHSRGGGGGGRRQYQWQLWKESQKDDGVEVYLDNLPGCDVAEEGALSDGSRTSMSTERQVLLITCRHYPLRLSVSFTKNTAIITGRRKYGRRVRQMWAICTLVASDCDCPGRKIKKKWPSTTKTGRRREKQKFSDSELQGPHGGGTEAP